MKNVLTAVLALALPAMTALAQNHPFPGSKVEAPVICTNCPGTNSQGARNDGKPTYPYDAPLLEHAGRLVDSSNIINFQNSGIRTVRAGKIRVAPSRNRIYVQLGEAVGVYALDTFFTGELAQPMELVNRIATGNSYSGRGSHLEKVHEPDGFFYAESRYSGWATTLIDSQKHLNDFDVDDRGYFYVASVYFGWGIHRENQDATGDHLPFVANLQGSQTDTIFAFGAGTAYYAAVSRIGTTNELDLYEVTIPASPVKVVTRTGTSHGVKAWAKYDNGQRLALLTWDGIVRVHSYGGFANGDPALATLTPTAGKSFADLTFDETGNLWIAETSNTYTTNALYKLTPAGQGYTTSSHSIPPGAFRPEVLHAGDGYIAIAGRDTTGLDLRLFRVGANGPELLDTDGFFQKYYSISPTGYAIPPSRYIAPRGLQLLRQGDSTYLIYNVHGLGDAYRISTVSSAITSIEPASGPPGGGTTVTLGTVNVTGDVTVTFGGVAATGTTVEEGRIITTTPPHAPGSVDVQVIAGGVTLTAPRQFTYTLEAPTNFRAEGSGPAAIALTWDAVDGAAQYELSRRNGTAWTILTTTPNRSFTDSSLGLNSGYEYRLRALDATGLASGYARDVATTVAFTAATITPGMVIRRVHVTDLRVAANALRTAAGLPQAAFDQTTYFRAADLLALRTAIAEARTAVGLPSAFTDNSLTANTVIKAVHLQELINAVR